MYRIRKKNEEANLANRPCPCQEKIKKMAGNPWMDKLLPDSESQSKMKELDERTVRKIINYFNSIFSLHILHIKLTLININDLYRKVHTSPNTFRMPKKMSLGI